MLVSSRSRDLPAALNRLTARPYNPIVLLVEMRLQRLFDPRIELIVRNRPSAGPHVQRIYINHWDAPEPVFDCYATRPLKRLYKTMNPYQTIRAVHHDLSTLYLDPEFMIDFNKYLEGQKYMNYHIRRKRWLNLWLRPDLERMTDACLADITLSNVQRLNKIRNVVLQIEKMRHAKTRPVEENKNQRPDTPYSWTSEGRRERNRLKKLLRR